jgi:hypothetical protein
VEGQTELSALNAVLGEHLAVSEIYIYPKIVGKPGHKGGVWRSFESISKEIVTLFKQEPAAAFTTFFDFYAMPENWPGVRDAKAAKSSGLQTQQVAQIVERAWDAAIREAAAALDHVPTFIPYVQMHELEALLFSNPQSMADAFLRADLAASFSRIVSESGGCEEINDRPQFAPSKRIEQIFPDYRKGRDKNKPEDLRPHAPAILKRAGLSQIREACPHFGAWVTSLEKLGKVAA